MGNLLVHPTRVSNPARLAGLEGRKKKGSLGRGQNVQCEKGPVRRQRKCPLPRQKALDAVRPRVPVTLWLTNKPSKTQKRRGPTLRARGAPLALTRARGGRDHPLPTSARSPTRASIKSVAAKQNRRGERNTRTREAQENPCRLASQEKGLRRSKENPKNARGPEWHPEKNAEKQDARPKRAKQKARRDTKREKEQAKRCVWGCPVTT